MIGKLFARKSRHKEARIPSPKPLLMQWHITERCNLRCAHCYQQSCTSDELDIAGLLDVLEQFKRLQESLRRESGLARHGQITVTGGEPFLRDDLFELLKRLHAEKPRISYAILSNGSFIDRATARRLQTLRPRFVQLSIEGTPETHDAIRGNGNHARTVKAVRELVAAGIPTLISFTAHKMNYREFPNVAELACKLGVRRVWADRMIPVGGGANLRALSPAETHEFISAIATARERLRRRWFVRTEVAMHRALQFLKGGHPYSCSAGDTLVTVQPNGDVYPCRRMPIRVGNLRETSLLALYGQSTTMNELRDPQRIPEKCAACAHSQACRGGLRCLAFSATGNPFKRDPGCWLH